MVPSIDGQRAAFYTFEDPMAETAVLVKYATP